MSQKSILNQRWVPLQHSRNIHFYLFYNYVQKSKLSPFTITIKNPCWVHLQIPWKIHVESLNNIRQKSTKKKHFINQIINQLSAPLQYWSKSISSPLTIFVKNQRRIPLQLPLKIHVESLDNIHQKSMLSALTISIRNQYWAP